MFHAIKRDVLFIRPLVCFSFPMKSAQGVGGGEKNGFPLLMWGAKRSERRGYAGLCLESDGGWTLLSPPPHADMGRLMGKTTSNNAQLF